MSDRKTIEDAIVLLLRKFLMLYLFDGAARLEFINRLTDGYCLHCGNWEPNGCHCNNDE